MMTITYADFESFHAGVLLLVQNGLTFKGDAGTLTIELLGGY